MVHVNVCSTVPARQWVIFILSVIVMWKTMFILVVQQTQVFLEERFPETLDEDRKISWESLGSE